MVIEPLAYLKSNLSIVPTKGKRPMVNWKQYQYQRPDHLQVLRWWNGHPQRGIAIICGVSSDGLAVFDFDSRDTFNDMLNYLDSLDYDFPIIGTPHGFHVYFRCDDLVRTTKLAMDDGVLVELKGVGGYVIAPSKGSGYELLAGSIKNIPVLEKDTVAKMVVEARKYDNRPPVDKKFRQGGKLAGKVIATPSLKPYIKQKLKEIAFTVANAGNGNRNNQLFSSACWLGEFVGGGYVTLDGAMDLLYNSAQDNGLVSDTRDGKNQTLKTIRYGLRQGMRKPLTIETESLLDGIPA